MNFKVVHINGNDLQSIGDKKGKLILGECHSVHKQKKSAVAVKRCLKSGRCTWNSRTHKTCAAKPYEGVSH